MKKHWLCLLSVTLLGIAPLTVSAMDNHENHGTTASTKQDTHVGHDHKNHSGMEMEGDTLMLGEQVVEGVEAMAHLKDVKEAMAKVGMTHTHHLMVEFYRVSDGEPMEQGLAAVKITDPAGKESGALTLVGMDGHFGADLALAEKGEYLFKIGTKLADGKKRQYEYKFSMK